MRTFALIYGIVFLIIGILGFTSQHFIEFFHFNIGLNILYIASGVLAFLLGLWKHVMARLYFQIVGVVYALLALLGFIYDNGDILGILTSNSPNTWFQVFIAIVALILGFGSKD